MNVQKTNQSTNFKGIKYAGKFPKEYKKVIASNSAIQNFSKKFNITIKLDSHAKGYYAIDRITLKLKEIGSFFQKKESGYVERHQEIIGYPEMDVCSRPSLKEKIKNLTEKDLNKALKYGEDVDKNFINIE